MSEDKWKAIYGRYGGFVLFSMGKSGKNSHKSQYFFVLEKGEAAFYHTEVHPCQLPLLWFARWTDG
jgi:hypothetical protein